jgi:hypothetical protein
MGYYDTPIQDVSSSSSRLLASGAKPYDIKEIMLATQGATAGIDKASELLASNRKAQQQMKANEYVSGLLGKSTVDNYQDNLMKAGTMSTYASPELMKQVDTSRAVFQRGEDKAYQLNRDTIGDAFKSGEFVQRDNQFNESIRQFNKNYDNELMKLAEMKRHNVSSEELQAQELKVRREQTKIDNMYKKWGIAKELDSAGYVIDPKTNMPKFTGASPVFQSALRTSKATGLLDPVLTRAAYNDQNTFGGLLAFDSTTNEPTALYNELVNAGKIHPSEKLLWQGKIATDPSSAHKALLNIK